MAPRDKSKSLTPAVQATVQQRPGPAGPTPSRGSMTIRSESYVGQVPHPEHLERFEALLPGATDRFLRLAENQSAHRQRMESRFMGFNGATQIIGAISASIIGIGATAGGFWLLMHDKQIEGFTSMFGTLATLVGVYLYGRRSNKQEMAAKQAAEER